MSQSIIGLNQEKSKELAEKLNKLLANFQVYYQNLRGFHWNIKGEHFFELHSKFEELYTDAQQKIDDIAERILTLGHVPQHTFIEYLESASIKVTSNVTDGRDGMDATLDAIRELLYNERDALKIADELEDEGTTALLSELINQQEKTVWMIAAWLNR